MDVRVPQLSEGVDAATVANILVSEGDEIERDQVIVELETEKAVGPIPSPGSGTVTKIHVKEGDEVAVGQVLISLSDGSAEKGAAKKTEPKAEERDPAPEKAGSATEGPKESAQEDYRYEAKGGIPPPAPPSIRKMARELDIDLTRVKGSGPAGRITLPDLRAYIQRLQEIAFSQPKAAAKKPAPKGIDFSQWGPVRKERLSALRRTVGERMAAAWSTIPHITQFDEADISRLMKLKKKYDSQYQKKGARLTLTSFALKAAIIALQKYPVFNASLDEESRELIYKDYYHIGVAVDTESGLIVPIVRNADKKSLFELAAELAALAEKTRQRKASLEDLQGGSFTISNLGSIGGTHFTPIIYKPQVAILGLGRGVQRPIIANGKAETRLILPVCVSYDHRVIDGADGVRFIREFVQALENFPEQELKLS